MRKIECFTIITDLMILALKEDLELKTSVAFVI